MCLVPWPLNRSEAGSDLVLLFVFHVQIVVFPREHDHLLMKNKKVCINKTRSPPASLLLKGQGTEHTTVKWPIPLILIIYCCILVS